LSFLFAPLRLCERIFLAKAQRRKGITGNSFFPLCLGVKQNHNQKRIVKFEVLVSRKGAKKIKAQRIPEWQILCAFA